MNLYEPDLLKTVHNSDELIVAEIRNKNEGALKEAYKAHFPMVLHLVCSNSGTEQEARDVYQEAMIAFYERLQQPGFVLTCKIKTYLYAVCWRLWLKRLGEKKRFLRTTSDIELFIGIEEEMVALDEQEQHYSSMHKAMEQLGEPCLSVIRDYYVNDLSMEAISLKYGYTNADNAKNQKYKCLQRLKKLFFKEHRD